MYLFLLIFRYLTSIACIFINNDYLGKLICDLVKGTLIRIAITQLLITLSEKYLTVFKGLAGKGLRKVNVSTMRPILLFLF